MNLDEPNVVLIDLCFLLLLEISRRMLTQVRFHLLEILLPQVEYVQLRFNWSRAMMNNFGDRVFSRLLFRGRILFSKVDAFAGTNIGFACHLGIRGGNVPQTKIRHRLRRFLLTHHSADPTQEFTLLGPLHPDSVHRHPIDRIDTLRNRRPHYANARSGESRYA